ncbi:MAG: diacylglycerol kinase family lipid kinase [Elusimicrobiota bacterium]|jgi:YegS/Rv2252/BmrU family lipid kinase|nr:diacylglycerol kinase family lipid kinase [Elusimicrobiota bacterium]
MKRLFIINPKSGAKKKSKRLEEIIKKYFPQAHIAFTERKNHAKELAQKAAAEIYNQVIVAGGDGTINEAAQSLAGKQTALGVIALGSGNGFAREIGAPLDDFEAACKNILAARETSYDLGLANGEYFLNLAGLGFEADIAASFDEMGKTAKRGKWPYFKIGIKHFFSYKAPRARVEIDGSPSQNMNLITLVFSNGRQYGSGFKIAPLASFDDGLLDMVVVEKTNIFKILAGLPNFLKKDLTPVEIRKFYKIKKAVVYIDGSFNYHIDGEPRRAKEKLEISILPCYIKVLTDNNSIKDIPQNSCLLF